MPRQSQSRQSSREDREEVKDGPPAEAGGLFVSHFVSHFVAIWLVFDVTRTVSLATIAVLLLTVFLIISRIKRKKPSYC